MTSRFRRSRPRRPTFWQGFGSALVSLAASVAVAADLQTLVKAALPSLSDYTLVRVRALYGVRPTPVSTTARFYDVGMTYVTEAAFAGGALPDPEDDDVPWLWHTALPWVPQLVTETAAGTFINGFSIVEIDNRAMRKIMQTDQSLVLITKNRQAVASEFFIEGRALLRLK